MKFFTLFFLVIGACPLTAAEPDSCEQAEHLVGDCIYFLVKNASLYGTDTTYLDVRVPTIYDPDFKKKIIEATIFLPNNQTMVFYCDSFMISDITDRCAGLYLQFNLLDLAARDPAAPNNSGSGYRIKKESIPFLLNSRGIWMLKPRK
jgi:hypothetical protein